MKKEIKVVVFESDSCVYNLPDKPQQFIEWWADKFALIPEEYKSKGHVECEAWTDDGIAQLGVTVSYLRLETDEEEYERVRKEDSKRQYIEDQERSLLRHLKAKYSE